MGVKVAWKAKLYRNVGTYAVPVLNEVPNVRDLTLDLDKDEDEVSRRGSGGWKEFVGTMKMASVEFGIVWDTADDDFLTWRGSYLDGTPVDCYVLDGDSAVAGAQGLRASFEVFKFPRSEELAKVLGASVSMKPTYAANPPQWVTTT